MLMDFCIVFLGIYLLKVYLNNYEKELAGIAPLLTDDTSTTIFGMNMVFASSNKIPGKRFDI